MRHVFSGQPLDRMDGVRGGDLNDENLRVLAIHEGSVLIIDEGTPRATTFARADARERDITLLGRMQEVTWAFCSVSVEELEELRERSRSSIIPIRAAAQQLERAEASIIAYAQALSSWQKRSRFCGSCGAPAVLEHSGHRRRCTAEACGELQFPRTDPSVIGIATYGEHCLLVNQPQWAPNRFATIAGFVEPGESLEEAMEREIREEVGLSTADMRYHSSQPWPFPMSLMIGFEVELAERRESRLSEEIREARWFTRAELREALQSGVIGIATPMSISFALIASWFGDREELVQLAAAQS